jgi:tetratricopeptide (TPR) repeat protein
MVVAVFCLTALGCGKDRQAQPVSGKAVPPAVKKQPAPVSSQKAATSSEEFNQARGQFNGESLLADYEAFGEQSSEWDTKVRTYFAEYTRSLSYAFEEGLLERLQPLGEELLDLGCSDPMVLYLRGHILHLSGRVAEARPLLEQALTLLEASDYPPRYTFYAARRLEWISGEASDPPSLVFMLRERKKMKYLGQAAGDPHFANGNQRFYLLDVLQLWDEPCANPNQTNVLIEELDAIPDLDPWIEHVVKGRYHVDLAWQARGGGWASTVTSQGWKLFAEELKTAETHLVEAHQLHPEFPEAATIMISVSMGGSGNVSPRKWFDRAVTAQFDYRPAYMSLLWALRPRWGGSHEAMYDFGIDCLNSGRFDTEVPRFFLKVVWDIASEMDDWRAAYRRPDTYRDMKVFFEGMLTEPRREAQQDYFKTVYGIVAWAAEESQDARRLFDELGDKADPAAFRGFLLDADSVIGDVYLRTGPRKEEYIAAEESFNTNQSIEALSLYEELLEETTDKPRARAVLQDRVAVLQMKKRFLDGDWVDILPDETFAGWEKRGGLWAFDADGSLKGTGRKADDQITLISTCDIPDNYEIRGKVTASSFVGVILGCTKTISPEYVLFNLDSAREKVSLLKSCGPPTIDCTKAIPETNRFHLQVWNSQVTVYVNDEPIFVAEDVSNMASPRDGRIGLKSLAYHTEGYSIQYHTIELRRLTEKPKEPEEQEPRTEEI